MKLADKLGMSGERLIIDWDLTPQKAFGIFESWGGKEWIPNCYDIFYYFYIDNWSPPAKLVLVERGVKHARILARIDAPQELLDWCVVEQGRDYRDKNYVINKALPEWLEKKIVGGEDFSLVCPVEPVTTEESPWTICYHRPTELICEVSARS